MMKTFVILAVIALFGMVYSQSCSNSLFCRLNGDTTCASHHGEYCHNHHCTCADSQSASGCSDKSGCNHLAHISGCEYHCVDGGCRCIHT